MWEKKGFNQRWDVSFHLCNGNHLEGLTDCLISLKSTCTCARAHNSYHEWKKQTLRDICAPDLHPATIVCILMCKCASLIDLI